MFFKKEIKKGLANLFTACGGYPICRRLNKNRLIVICYHRVVGKLGWCNSLKGQKVFGYLNREDPMVGIMMLIRILAKRLPEIRLN